MCGRTMTEGDTGYQRNKTVATLKKNLVIKSTVGEKKRTERLK